MNDKGLFRATPAGFVPFEKRAQDMLDTLLRVRTPSRCS